MCIRDSFSNHKNQLCIFRLFLCLRQGCHLSPLLFNIYREHTRIMWEIFDSWKGSIPVGGKNVNNLKNTLMILSFIVSSQEHIEKIMQKLKSANYKNSLYLNKKKLKLWLLTDQTKDTHANLTSYEVITLVMNFILLGSPLLI